MVRVSIYSTAISLFNEILVNYSYPIKALFVGEGNFSYTRLFIEGDKKGKKEGEGFLPRNIYTTSLESYDDVVVKHKLAKGNINILTRMGVIVVHNVAAQLLMYHPLIGLQNFERIYFNFPEAPDKPGHVKMSQAILFKFFMNCSKLLNETGTVHMNFRTSNDYESWDLMMMMMIIYVDYSYPDKALFVGEGNFSYTRLFIEGDKDGKKEVVGFLPCNIYTTSLESYDEVNKHKLAKPNLEILTRMGVKVVYIVDAQLMIYHPLIGRQNFERIYFNFPEAPNSPGHIKMSRAILFKFFRNCSRLLNETGTFI